MKTLSNRELKVISQALGTHAAGIEFENRRLYSEVVRLMLKVDEFRIRKILKRKELK